MAATKYLFDVDPFTQKPRRQRRPGGSGLTPQVRAALARLRRTIDEVPEDEWARRKARWDELVRTVKQVRN